MLRYEIYHASFREVLKAHHHDGPGSLVHEMPSELEEGLADELTLATRAAHRRVADSYVRDFGGFGTGLSVLAVDPDAASVDDGYPLHHLTRHLDHAGAHHDMHQLLAASHVTADSLVSNVWFAAHDYADCVSSYLEDLSQARQASAHATNRSVSRKHIAPTLGTEVRYALMAASILSRTNRISPSLLKQLIDAGVWSTLRGLDHARRLANPANRFHALMAVYASSQDPTNLAEALAAASAITSDLFCAQALTALVRQQPLAI
jgi:hypothetical protein